MLKFWLKFLEEVDISWTFLRSLKVFISSREIDLCRLDTFPIMVANKSSVHNQVLALALL